MLAHRSLVVAVCLCSALTACGTRTGTEAKADRLQTTSSQQQAVSSSRSRSTSQRCDVTARDYARQFGEVDELVGDFTVTATVAAAWEAARDVGHGNTLTYFSSLPPQEEVTLCFFDGSFSPPLPGPIGSHHDLPKPRILIMVQDGRAGIYDSGTPQTLRPAGLAD